MTVFYTHSNDYGIDVMPDQSSQPLQDPYVFSRGSLTLTYEQLRKSKPALALIVRNIANGVPLEKSSEQTNNKHSDHFRITLDSFQVREVVETLVSNAQGQPDEKSGINIMLKALLEDWLALARKMLEELPPEQRP